jgi:uncharacterized protein (TIGR01777 family)
MDVAITGASGLIGTALGSSLRADGHRVVEVVRRRARPGEDVVSWDPVARTIDRAGLEGLDAVVHLAGAGIGDHRWTPEYKRTILESRTKTTSLLAETLATLQRPPAVLVSGSAVGYYGERGDDVVTEDDPPGDSFLADVVVRWEGSARAAVDAGIRVAFARTGVVLTPQGGALAQLLPLFKLGLGGRMGSGRQWWSWITLDDEVGALRFLLDHDVAGPANLTAPNPVTNAELARTLGRVLGRPALLPIPSFGPKLLKGAELAQELLFTSARVEPRVLAAAGFAPRHPELEGALRAVLDRPAA